MAEPRTDAEGSFSPPPLVWETLGDVRDAAARHPGGVIDLTVGTPGDPPPALVGEVLARSAAARAYPPSIGSDAFRSAAADWLARRFDVAVDPGAVAATIGSKELVAGLPQWLRLRRPERDTVLHPAIAYPTYAMGARLAGCRAVAVPARADGALDLAAIAPDDAARALCLWSNSPSNPTGALDDLDAVAAWGRDHDVVVASDECYAELTWDGPPRTVLASGLDGVLAVHSLSKRSNLAGLRVGFYAGDPELVAYLSQLRKHAGFMVAGPVQEVATAVLADDAHATVQRERYRHRLEAVSAALRSAGLPVTMPGGAFYLWLAAPSGDGLELTRRLAGEAGILVTPGSAYGPDGESFVRMALVLGDDRLDDLVARLAHL